MTTGLRLRGEIAGGRVVVCTVDEEGGQLVIFELDDSGLLRVLVADLVDGEPVERVSATLRTLGGDGPEPALCLVEPLALSEAA